MKSVLEVMADLFGAHFVGPSWDAWRAFLAALFALPMPEAQAAVYRRCTGRWKAPAAPAREGWMVVGRRGGKSRIAALLAVFLACFRKYRLALGERGVVMVIAADRKQARVVLRYIRALLHSHPMLETLIEHERKESIDLTNGITIELHTASFRTVRGYTVVAAILDEIAFWPVGDDAAEPDSEILAALRPAMATVPDAMLLALSSPYARRGELWNAFQRHFGRQDNPVMVWRADTRTMNPCVPASVIDEAYAADPAAAAAEYGAEFRRDIETFIDREALAGLVVKGRLAVPLAPGTPYVAFTDPAGGSGGDSFTLAIVHLGAAGRVVLDLVCERRSPFSPEQVVAEFAATLGVYGVSTVISDRYAGDWPLEQWRRHRVTCKPSDRSKSEIYRDLLPLLNSGQVELLDHPRLIAQLAGLERRTSRGGRDSIDHAPGAHDDVANAVAGALVNCAVSRAHVITTRRLIGM